MNDVTWKLGNGLEYVVRVNLCEPGAVGGTGEHTDEVHASGIRRDRVDSMVANVQRTAWTDAQRREDLQNPARIGLVDCDVLTADDCVDEEKQVSASQDFLDAIPELRGDDADP